MIEKEPNFFMQIWAMRTNVHRKMVLPTIHMEFRYKKYVLTMRQRLSNIKNVKRPERCKLLIDYLKQGAAGRIRFIYNKKMSTVHARINHYNDRWLF